MLPEISSNHCQLIVDQVYNLKEVAVLEELKNVLTIYTKWVLSVTGRVF